MHAQSMISIRNKSEFWMDATAQYMPFVQLHSLQAVLVVIAFAIFVHFLQPISFIYKAVQSYFIS